MWKTILRRLLIMIPQLFLVSVLVFVLAKAMPGDPFTGKFGPNTDPNEIAALRQAAGLNDPWTVQYARWIGNAFHGDFGQSLKMISNSCATIINKNGKINKYYYYEVNY